MNHIGSLGCIFFTDQEVSDYESAKTSDTGKYADYCNYMLEHGIYLAPAQFEAMFLSMAHTELQLMETLRVMEAYSKDLWLCESEQQGPERGQTDGSHV